MKRERFRSRIEIRVQDNMYRDLKAIALKHDASMSEVCREILKNGVKKSRYY